MKREEFKLMSPYMSRLPPKKPHSLMEDVVLEGGPFTGLEGILM
jgi:hypothetical protein